MPLAALLRSYASCASLRPSSRFLSSRGLAPGGGGGPALAQQDQRVSDRRKGDQFHRHGPRIFPVKSGHAVQRGRRGAVVHARGEEQVEHGIGDPAVVIAVGLGAKKPQVGRVQVHFLAGLAPERFLRGFIKIHKAARQSQPSLGGFLGAANEQGATVGPEHKTGDGDSRVEIIEEAAGLASEVIARRGRRELAAARRAVAEEGAWKHVLFLRRTESRYRSNPAGCKGGCGTLETG